MSTLIFSKTYDGNSLCDLGRDVEEAWEGEYNEAVRAIPVDEFGFPTGQFVLTIVWSEGP